MAVRRKITDPTHHGHIRLIRVRAFICVHRLPFSKGGVQEISTGHGEDRGFYSSGVGSFQTGGGRIGDFGRQVGGVTEAEPKYSKLLITRPETMVCGKAGTTRWSQQLLETMAWLPFPETGSIESFAVKITGGA